MIEYLTLYSWCSSLLEEHLANTVKVVYMIPRLRKIIEIIAFKLQLLDNNLSNEEARELVILPIMLHDIGKACDIYQRTVYVDERGVCKANFKYHEIIGATLISEALSYIPELKNSIKYSITISILNHHYAIRIFDNYTHKEVISEITNKRYQLVTETIEMLQHLRERTCMRSKLAEEIINKIIYVISCLNNKEMDLKDTVYSLLAGIKGGSGYRFLREIGGEPQRFNKLPYYLASSMTGLINISDNISAHCERGGTSVFVKDILREVGVTCFDIIGYLYKDRFVQTPNKDFCNAEILISTKRDQEIYENSRNMK